MRQKLKSTSSINRPHASWSVWFPVPCLKPAFLKSET
nr:MAG TPA: hypothetical protein [Caudoviricetes sp.]